MMHYYIYELRFTTPVHFGDGQSHSLSGSKLTCAADTFFSALCNEIAMWDEAGVSHFRDAVEKGCIRMSSLFPWKEKNGEKQYYLPKPLFPVKAKRESHDFEETKRIATGMKKMKKAEYLRISQLQRFLAGQLTPTDMAGERFAVPATVERLNTRGERPIPYFVGSYLFHHDAGLYVIMGFDDEKGKESFEKILTYLSYSGIGGKRSSGYGKFCVTVLGMNPAESISQDLQVLNRMLADTTAPLQMAVAPLLPSIDDLAVVKAGRYKILQRSGFVSSPSAQQLRKKNNTFMLAEGSVFSGRLQGRMGTQQMDGLQHELYQNGVGLFVGVAYDGN